MSKTWNQVCTRCAHSWRSYVKNPKQCPRCHSAYWNKAKTGEPGMWRVTVVFIDGTSETITGREFALIVEAMIEINKTKPLSAFSARRSI